jgi:hypothetical protein
MVMHRVTWKIKESNGNMRLVETTCENKSEEYLRLMKENPGCEVSDVYEARKGPDGLYYSGD